MEHPVKLQREVKGAGDCNCAEEILEQVGLVDAKHQAVLLHQVQVHLEQPFRIEQDENYMFTWNRLMWLLQ